MKSFIICTLLVFVQFVRSQDGCGLVSMHVEPTPSYDICARCNVCTEINSVPCFNSSAIQVYGKFDCMTMLATFYTTNDCTGSELLSTYASGSINSVTICDVNVFFSVSSANASSCPCVPVTPTSSSPSPSPSPSPSTVSVCGNGYLELGEECDDGNTVDHDGCHSDCRLEECFELTACAIAITTYSPYPSYCAEPCESQGYWYLDEDISLDCYSSDFVVEWDCSSGDAKLFVDGKTEPNYIFKVCTAHSDDGAPNIDKCFNGYSLPRTNGYSTVCQSNICGSVCGDGQVTGSEQCEDGNPIAGDGCFNCMYEHSNCTLTTDDWVNYYPDWPSSYQNATACGQTYIQTLLTPPKSGDAYYILMHQYIAYLLNVEFGATVEDAIQTDVVYCLIHIYSVLTSGECNNPNLYPKGSEARKEAVNCADVFTLFNEGITGPGYCINGTLPY